MNNKKMAAAMSAVMTYIKTEEDNACMQSIAAEARRSRPRRTGVNLWGGSGRQDQMQMRGFLQMKSFHGSKLR